MNRNWLLTLHRTTGLVSGIFILILSVSGAILVFGPEIERGQYPVLTIEPAGGFISLDSATASLRKSYPHGRVSNCSLPALRADPYVFTIYDSSFHEGLEPLRIFAHPQTGRVVKSMGARNTFGNWVTRLHTSFLLGRAGEWLLGVMGIVFLVNLLTGVLLYRKKVIPVLLLRKTVFRRSQLHQVIGVYALLFNIMIAATGSWMQRYVFKRSFYSSAGFKPVFRSSPPPAFSLDSSLEVLAGQYPDFSGYVIYFPYSKGGQTAVYGSRSGNSFIHSKQFADAIFLDSTGRIASTAFVTEIGPSKRYDIVNSQIHFGQYGGTPVKIIYFLLGLSGGLLSITGFLPWWRRKRRARLRSLGDRKKEEGSYN